MHEGELLTSVFLSFECWKIVIFKCIGEYVPMDCLDNSEVDVILPRNISDFFFHYNGRQFETAKQMKCWENGTTPVFTP